LLYFYKGLHDLTEKWRIKMNKVLYITANPKPEDKSFGLGIGREFINAYKRFNPSDEITELPLYKTDIPFIDADIINGWEKLQSGSSFNTLDPDEQEKIRQVDKLTDQFITSDKYIFVSPLWNFSIPPVLKAYIDTISIAGKTFKYTENGPVGLLENKKALHIQASGGLYSEGEFKYFEFGNNYLKSILNFLGVNNFESLFIEGMAIIPADSDKIKSKALERALSLAGRF
jgi:FMN-dependent NADH-azoreductase